MKYKMGRPPGRKASGNMGAYKRAVKSGRHRFGQTRKHKTGRR